jgi:hypothetical protein
MSKITLLLLASIVVGCAEMSAIGSSNDDDSTVEIFSRVVDYDRIHSVQLHPDKSETALPVVEMNSGMKLRLAFDLVEEQARPLTVYFYHADRNWERDLTASEYLTSFNQDEILDYRASGATVIPYVHYEYSFPNRSLDFKLSGNYILRVSEQGRENEALFERSFFVTEQSTPIEMRLDQVMVAGMRSTSVQPSVLFSAPDANSSVFDYSVCFIRNSEIGERRCVTRPSLDVQPDMSFYLQPDDSFGPQAANFFIDLSEMRTGGRIERVNQQPIPWRIEIAPDYARFSGTQLAPFLNGQSVIRSANRYLTEPDYSSEYVNAVFKYITPDGGPIDGSLVIVGSFTNWESNPDNTLRWNELNGWYETRILLKQGRYEYAYLSDNLALHRAKNNGLPQIGNRFTSFVYYHDLFAQTDRLLAVQGIKTE